MVSFIHARRGAYGSETFHSLASQSTGWSCSVSSEELVQQSARAMGGNRDVDRRGSDGNARLLGEFGVRDLREVGYLARGWRSVDARCSNPPSSCLDDHPHTVGPEWGSAGGFKVTRGEQSLI